MDSPTTADPTNGIATLAELRRLRGLSQSDLARLTGLRQETICRAERGKPKALRPSSVRLLAQALTHGDTMAVVRAYEAGTAAAKAAEAPRPGTTAVPAGALPASAGPAGGPAANPPTAPTGVTTADAMPAPVAATGSP
ncbi:MAG: Helix-turn-helix domain [Planctomycetota bacterium]|jgi:hypothetical protein